MSENHAAVTSGKASVGEVYRSAWVFAICAVLFVFMIVIGALATHELSSRATQADNLRELEKIKAGNQGDIASMLRDISTLNNNGSIGDRCNVLQAITRGTPEYQKLCADGKAVKISSILGLGIDEYPLDILFFMSTIAFACVGAVATGFRQGGVTPASLVLGVLAGLVVALAIKGGVRAFVGGGIVDAASNPFLAGLIALAAGAFSDRVYLKIGDWIRPLR